MPVQKMNMIISNNNRPPLSLLQNKSMNTANVASVPRPPSSLSAPIISRIHNVQPGCGGCGRG